MRRWTVRCSGCRRRRIRHLVPDCLEKLLHSTIVIEIHNWSNDFEHRYFAFLESAFNLFKVEVLSPVSRDIHKYQELRDFTDDNRRYWFLSGDPAKCVS